nr:unnamed protein product [Callosobruchus chinensis]
MQKFKVTVVLACASVTQHIGEEKSDNRKNDAKPQNNLDWGTAYISGKLPPLLRCAYLTQPRENQLH